ncbi:hypothetical protein J4H86_16045 [Spiractinospora alimapuensis]|uniref:hypothetical protein n=1 Tax=Spiractinospora alimapuensis TaxID=2820884 RepID=UPI001F30109F|nr:hypothetical protein [Spiractinospora alimapuensis]QVQ50433.1 hypothetical protein J4H86_16045 [Spiractinospora alimapuensis]
MEVVTMAALITLAILSTWYGFDRRARRRALSQRFRHTTHRLDELTVPLASLVDNLDRQIELVRGAYAEDELPRVLGGSIETLRSGTSLLLRQSDLTTDRESLLRARDLDGVSETIHSWQDLEASVRRVLPALRAEEERLTQAIARSLDVADHLHEISSLTVDLRSRIDSAAEQGFVTTAATAVLDGAPGRVTQVRHLIAHRQILAAQDALDGLVADLTTAIDDVLRLPRRRQHLATRVDTQTRDLRELDELTGQAAVAQAELTTHFAATLSVDLASSRALADEHATRAARQLERARHRLAEGDLDDAERLADAADVSHDAARTQLQHPTRRLAAVRDLRDRLPERRTRLYEQTVELEKHAERETVTASFTAVAREIRVQLDRVDLASEYPDWLECDRRIDEIETLIDRTDAGVRHCLTAIGQLRGEARSLTRRLREERSARYEAEGIRRWRSEPAF